MARAAPVLANLAKATAVNMDRRLQLLNEDGDATASQSSTPSYLASLFVWFLITASNMPTNCLLKC
jgi:hypothetical protein